MWVQRDPPRVVGAGPPARGFPPPPRQGPPPAYYQRPPPAPGSQRNWLLIGACILAVFVVVVIIVLAVVLPVVLLDQGGASGDVCGSAPCGVGVCVPSGDDFECRCPAGYSGESCETMDAPPIVPACRNGELQMENDAYRCDCFEGYYGSVCQYDTNECQSNNGGCMGTCDNKAGSYVCKCGEGYVLAADRLACDDVNECDGNPCDNGACTNLAGGYECRCDAGYKGAHCEADIDECAEGSDRCASSCTNFDGGYQCDCPMGEASSDGFNCMPLNMCTASTCKNGGTCQDVQGEPVCTCSSHWEGRYCEFDRDECLSSNGGCTGNCKNKLGSFECSCGESLVLSEDMKTCLAINECLESPCMHGECVDTSDGYTCLCEDGYEGVNCDEDIDECGSSHSCGGICVNTVGGYDCNCPSGQIHPSPNSLVCVDIRECDGNPCGARGFCHEGDEGFTCTCQRGIGGEFCDVDLCDTHTGWMLNEDTGHCYKYFRTADQSSFYFPAAEGLCQSHEGHLMSINSRDEMAWLHAHIFSKINVKVSTTNGKPDEYLFTGLYFGDPRDPTTWYWTDGSPVDVASIQLYNSETTSSSYHCVYVELDEINYGASEFGVLYRYYCDTSGDTVCEKMNNVELSMSKK